MAEHIFAGSCPDETQPDVRDANCPACELIVETGRLEDRIAALTVERDALKDECDRLLRLSASTQATAATAFDQRDEAIRERDAARGVLTQAVRELGDWRDGSEVMRDELVDDFLEAARAALPEIAKRTGYAGGQGHG